MSIIKINLNGRSMFAFGNIELLNKPMVSVAGSRKITSEASEWLQNIIPQYSNYSIVSGLAIGADTVAHRTALENNIPTIAVLPSGLRNIHPSNNGGLARKIVREGGLVITEYNHKDYPCRENYIARNKIIAELGDCLIMPQCDEHSGTMHTVRFANKLNKNIVLPDLDFTGNKYLINDDGFNTIVN